MSDVGWDLGLANTEETRHAIEIKKKGSWSEECESMWYDLLFIEMDLVLDI